MYAMSLKRFTLKAALANPPPIYPEGATKKWTWSLKLGSAIHWIEKFIYKNFYYYFMAYGVIAVTGILGVPQTA